MLSKGWGTGEPGIDHENVLVTIYPHESVLVTIYP